MIVRSSCKHLILLVRKFLVADDKFNVYMSGTTLLARMLKDVVWLNRFAENILVLLLIVFQQRILNPVHLLLVPFNKRMYMICNWLTEFKVWSLISLYNYN